MQNSTFSKRLAEAMSIREMTQTDLHERTGINKSSISTYLRGLDKNGLDVSSPQSTKECGDRKSVV